LKFDLFNDDLLKICKSADIDDLNLLSRDIREFLIEKVSRTGGHLASNLGIVELSIALMRVFNSPQDRIIYDVGHQTYVHKILTGRADGFDNLRQYKGMSGFPKSRESVYDAYDTGHSSTSISAAYGMAVARDLKGEDYNIVAVIGDGSFTGGIVYEALNNIGANKTNINIILNDNGMSIARNVGAMSKYLTKLRSSEKYDQAKIAVKSALTNMPAVKNTIRTSKRRLRYNLIGEEGHIIEDLGIKYYGPVDGYNIEALAEVISAASKYDGPTLIHVITTKGKGYHYAELYPRKFHGIAPFNPETGELLSSASSPSYSKVFGEKVTELADRNDNICAVVAAMGTATGLTPFYEKHQNRYFDVGIAEEHAVTFAAGLAKAGFTPFVAIYSSFLQRAFDYIIEDIALQHLHVIFAIDRAGLVGADGETHHGQFDLSYMSMIPGMTIFAPADGMQLEEIIEYSVDIDGPVAIRYPRGSSEGEHIRIKAFKGKNNTLKSGSDVQILAVGSMLDEAIKAAERLKKRGLDVGVTNVCVIKPMSNEFSKIKTRLVVTLEDNVLHGGFGEAFTAQFHNSDFDIINIAIPDQFIEHGSVAQLRKECKIDADSIYRRVKNHLEGKA